MLKRTKTFVPRVNNKEESPYKPDSSFITSLTSTFLGQN